MGVGLIYPETADTAQQETAACNTTKHMGIPYFQGIRPFKGILIPMFRLFSCINIFYGSMNFITYYNIVCIIKDER